MEDSITVSGINKLMQSFEDLIGKYPDRAGELLEKTGKDLRKDVVKMVKRDTKTDGSDKHSLAKIGSYRVSKAKGIGTKQYVEISAKSPHFHLVENGHNLVINGQNRGFVPGKHMMSTTTKEYENKMPDVVDSMVDTLIKESGL